VREGERKGWEEKRREGRGRKGREREETAREGKNVLPHSKQAVVAYARRRMLWDSRSDKKKHFTVFPREHILY